MIEHNKTYDFKIKLANLDVNSELLDRIEHALSSFEVNTMSKPKQLPIENTCIDFPQIQNCEVTLIIVSLNYPCNDEQLRQTISLQGRLPLANVVVIPVNQPEEEMRDLEIESKDKPKEAILTKDLEEITGGQELVGQKRIESMLKELESRRMEFAASDIPKKAETLNDLPQGNESPVDRRAHNLKGR